MMQKQSEIIAIFKAIDDRIDYLKARYRDSQGEERMEWKSRLNEAKTVRESVLVVLSLDARMGDATDLLKGN